MKRIFALMCMFVSCYIFTAQTNEEKMALIRKEVVGKSTVQGVVYSVTANSHPMLYTLIKKIVAKNEKCEIMCLELKDIHQKAKDDLPKNATQQQIEERIKTLVERQQRAIDLFMPPYIRLLSDKFTYETAEDGTIKLIHAPLKDSADPFIMSNSLFYENTGGLYIYKELILICSYEELEGLIALALSEDSIGDKPRLIFCVGLCATLLVRGAYVSATGGIPPSQYDQLKTLSFALAISAIARIISKNYLQKKIHTYAAQLTSPQSVINGLRKARELTFNGHAKPNLVMKTIASIVNTLLSPVRAPTFQERLDYLEKLKLADLKATA